MPRHHAAQADHAVPFEIRAFAVRDLGLDLAQRRYLTDTGDLTFGIGTVFVMDPDGNVMEFVNPARGIFAQMPPL